MSLQSMALVFVGAGAGGVARYLLGIALNPLVASLPLGTLAVNLSGSYLAGTLVALLALRAELDPVLRLLLVTGFLGGFTTFSAFAVEVSMLLTSQRWAIAAGAIGLHVAGSIGAALLGFATVRIVQNS